MGQYTSSGEHLTNIRPQPASSLTQSDSLCRAQDPCMGLGVQNAALQGLLSIIAQEAVQ